MSDDTAFYLIRDAVARRRYLVHGRLHYGRHHCAIGAFFADNPNAVLHEYLIDEVAAVNDSVPVTATPQERWRKVSHWLRWKLRVLAAQTIAKEQALLDDVAKIQAKEKPAPQVQDAGA